MTEYVVTLRIAGNSTGAADALKVVDADLKKVQSTAKDTEGQAQKMSASWTKAGVAMGTAIAATATAMVVMTAKAINAADEVDKLAKRFGSTSEFISGFGQAAALAGGSVRGFQDSLEPLSAAIAKAAGGQKQYSQLFDAMGISVRDAQGKIKSLEQLLPEIAAKFRTYEDGPAKAALATKLFGSAAAEMSPVLSKTATELNDARVRAQDLGLELSTSTTAAANQFKDNLGELLKVGEGFFNQIATDILPILVDLSASFVDGADDAITLTKETSLLAGTLKLIAVAAAIAKNALEIMWSIAMGAIDSTAGVLKGTYDTIRDGVTGIIETTATALKGRLREAVSTYAGTIRGVAATAKDAAGNVSKSFADMTLDVSDDLEDIAKAFDLGVRPAVDGASDALKRGQAPVVEYGKAAGNSAKQVSDLAIEISGMAAAANAALPDVQDFPQTLTPFMLEFQEGTVEAGERYTEFSGVVQEQSSFAYDAISTMIDAAIYDWDHMGDAMIDMARRFLSQIAQMFLQQQFQMNVGMSGGSGGGFNLGGMGGGGAGFLGGLGQLLGPAALLYAGAASGNPGQGALYGAGAGLMFASGTIGASLIGGTALAGGISAGTGAALGSVVPVIGTIIGALIGAAAAYFMQEKPPAIDVIGPGLVGTPGYRNLSPGSTYESGLGGFTFASIDSVDREARDQIAGYIQEFDNTIASFLTPDELTRVTGALADFQLHLEEGGINIENILGQRWDAILSAFPEDVQEVVRAAGTLEEQVQKLGEVLRFPEAINAILENFANADLLAGMTEMERQIHAVNKQFDDAKAALVAMGATEAQLAEIETYRANALERLAQLQQDQLDALLDPLWFEDLTEGMTPSEREIARINKYYDDLKDQAIALGATQEELALIERRRNAALSDAIPILEQTVDVLEELPNVLSGLDQLHDDSSDGLDDWRRAMQQVRDFLNGERYSATSTLTPEQMLRAAQGDFADLLSRAQGGDSAAAGGLAAAAQRLLDLGRSYYASGDEYDALRNSVLGSLSPFGNLANNPSSQLHDAMNALRTAFVQFGQYLQEWNNRNNPPGSAANGANYAGGESAMMGELRGLREEMRGVKTAVSAAGDKQASAIREGLKRGVA